MLKVWNSLDHRATMDIDLLGRTSNQIENLQKIIQEVSKIACIEDEISFETEGLFCVILRQPEITMESAAAFQLNYLPLRFLFSLT